MISGALHRLYWRLPSRYRSAIYKVLRYRQYNDFQELKRAEAVSAYAYSLKPFTEQKCIFVHIPRCAGVSISVSLFGNLSGGHNSIATYQRIFSKREYEEYYKFTFVRNPWDRLFSAFHFLVNGGFNSSDKDWASKFLSPYSDFSQFVASWVTPENIHKGIHFRPQYTFLCLPNSRTPLVDFIGRFETLATDFSTVQNRLGLPTVKLLHQNITEMTKGKYRDHYDEKTRNIVAKVYKEDIEMFGYTFA